MSKITHLLIAHLHDANLLNNPEAIIALEDKVKKHCKSADKPAHGTDKLLDFQVDIHLYNLQDLLTDHDEKSIIDVLLDYISKGLIADLNRKKQALIEITLLFHRFDIDTYRVRLKGSLYVRTIK